MKLIVFDIDGTLTASSKIDGDCLAQVMSDHLGGVAVDTDWNHYPTFTDNGIADHLWKQHLRRGLTDAEDARLEEDFLSLLKRESHGEFEPVAGAVEFFRSLRDTEHLAVAIATGSWCSSAEYKLECAGIPFRGVPLATCNDAGVREGIMRCAEARAREHHGVAGFEGVIYFGDGAWDVRATRGLEWRMIGIGENIERLRELGVEHLFSDYCSPADIKRAL